LAVIITPRSLRRALRAPKYLVNSVSGQVGISTNISGDAAYHGGVCQKCLTWLLLEVDRGPADALPFEVDAYLNTVGNLDERNAAIHAVLFSVEGHCSIDCSRTCPLADDCEAMWVLKPRVLIFSQSRLRVLHAQVIGGRLFLPGSFLGPLDLIVPSFVPTLELAERCRMSASTSRSACAGACCTLELLSCTLLLSC
jgi:hypothetical protein